jgi:excinuclease ABC subunit C
MKADFVEKNVKSIPSLPGVYLFKDAEGNFLYIGKAANLRHRVGSYLQKSPGREGRILEFGGRVTDVETIVTDTEKEAFILEDNLIKQHRPRYNIRLRDDKYYPCLRLSAEEKIPTLSIVRRVHNDGALYFGPYPSARSLRETVKLIRKIFPIRTSLDTEFSPRLPAWAQIDPAGYEEVVAQVRMFLEGEDRALLDELRKKMAEEAGRLNFEGAARIRDQIGHIENVLEKQKAAIRDTAERDVIGFHREKQGLATYLLFLRGGKLAGGKGFSWPSSELPREEILESFIQQYYGPGKLIPREILIPFSLPGQRLIEEWLSEKKQERVGLVVPRGGELEDLVNLAQENARSYFSSEKVRETNAENLLADLRETLRLPRTPRRIEGFDISNLGGLHAVGSMVSFLDGKPDKNRYRRFKIKTIAGSDDYGMMKEVLLRRFRKGDDLPDLVLVDGGRGQLNVARQVFEELKIREVELLSLAKERNREESGPHEPEKTEEKIFRPDSPEPILLDRSPAVLTFLDRVRDEAHRFAVAYHQKVRGKEAMGSRLAEVPGVGANRRRELLNFFGSMEKISEASPEELLRVPSMNRRAAEAVYDFFHPSRWQASKPKPPISDDSDG